MLKLILVLGRKLLDTGYFHLIQVLDGRIPINFGRFVINVPTLVTSDTVQYVSCLAVHLSVYFYSKVCGSGFNSFPFIYKGADWAIITFGHSWNNSLGSLDCGGYF